MVSPLSLCVYVSVCGLKKKKPSLKWNGTDQLSVLLSGAVVAAEPKVQALRKLPEDIEWSYTGLYEAF